MWNIYPYLWGNKNKTIMKKVQILKNGKLIKQFSCPVNMVQKYFDLAYDIAGGMWNGEDKFTVVIN